MTKQDLKSGMVVEYRNGNKMLLVGDNLFGVDGYSTLLNYNDDLESKLFSILDIIKVYKYKSAGSLYDLLEDDNLELIWERKDIEISDGEIKLSDKEIEILKALKVLGYKFLARDESLYLYAYSDKPYKSVDCWLLNDGEYVGVNNVFNSIEWEDDEPTNIDDLLKELEK